MNFFELLARRTKREPSKETERKLSIELDRAFALDFRKESGFAGFARGLWELSVIRFAPLGAVAILLFVFAQNLGAPQVREESVVAVWSEIEAGLIANESDFEFYEEMEDWMLSASDEEWAELLGDDPVSKGGKKNVSKDT